MYSNVPYAFHKSYGPLSGMSEALARQVLLWIDFFSGISSIGQYTFTG